MARKNVEVVAECAVHGADAPTVRIGGLLYCEACLHSALRKAGVLQVTMRRIETFDDDAESPECIGCGAHCFVDPEDICEACRGDGR